MRSIRGSKHCRKDVQYKDSRFFDHVFAKDDRSRWKPSGAPCNGREEGGESL